MKLIKYMKIKKRSAPLKRPKKTDRQTKTLEKFRRMATVIQDSNDAITFQDLDGNILAWNRGAEKMYGYSETEALTKNIVDTVPREYQEEALEFIKALKRGELVPTLETKRKTKDGKIVDVWLTNTKLTDDKGKLTGIATTERDISERKHSEASLREKFRELDYLREGQIALSERMRGEQIISRLGQSILSHLVPFTNAQVGAFYAVTDNKKLQRVSGYALGTQETQAKIIDFGEGLIGQVALDKRSLMIENVPTTYFNRIQSDLGEMIPRSLLICPILYENEVMGVIELGSLHPFTEHQRVFLSHVAENIGIAINTSEVRKKVQELLEQSQTLNEKLQTQQEELKTANEALNKASVLLEEKANEVQRASQYKTEFLANMSHELRTPLNSSLILAKLLMDNAGGNLSDEQIQFASSIHSSGHDLLNLINDVLDLSKVEAGKLDIRAENVNLSHVIAGLNQTFQSFAQEKKLKFIVSSDADTPLTLLTDRQRLDQILKNLISNAFKFTASGSVSIRIYPHSNRQLGFEVSDTGIGIPKEQQQIIFEAFRQADGTTNRKFGGTGLGLSISKDLARLLGGSIEVHSAPGQGSRFILILPVIYEETAQPSTAALSQVSANVSLPDVPLPLPFEDDRATLSKDCRTFLIIEDEIKFSKILLDLARELKYKCLVAQSADEGFSMALEFCPDAIILDMKLPDHLGLVVLDRLKKNSRTRHIPVHIISGEDYIDTALNMGAIGYLLKPANRNEIKEAFKKLEKTFLKTIDHVLIVEKDEAQRKNICQLLADVGIEFTEVSTGSAALSELKKTIFDCIIMDLNLSDMPGEELMQLMVRETISSFPPVIIFSGRALTAEEEKKLKGHSKTLTIKGARSPEGLLDEVSLFLHQVETELPSVRNQMLKVARSLESKFDGKTILLVDDDIRNIFALTSALEQKGVKVIIARNGIEALERLELDSKIDLVLMDVMMPEMDGHEATRRIRKQQKYKELPIISVTAKAMKDDQLKCLAAGANDYISKPVDLDKLLSIIRVWMPA